MWLSNHQGNQHFTLKLFTLTYMSMYVCLLRISQRTCNQNINLTKTKRSHMPCFLYSAIIFPVSISLSICHYAIGLLTTLSLPLSLSLSLSLIEHVDSHSNRLIPLFRVTQLIVFNLLL